MRVYHTVMLWFFSMVALVAVVNTFRWLGIETEAFDFIGRMAVGVGLVALIDNLVFKRNHSGFERKDDKESP
jgi:purine-cytosine permease-like protein